MKIIDFHLHITQTPDVNKELHILDYDFKNQLAKLSARLKKSGIDKGMVFFLDTRFLKDVENLQSIKELVSVRKINNLVFAVTPDFRNGDVCRILNRAETLGVKGLKFHPIHQKILPRDYEKIKEIAIFSDSKGLIIIIDTHYVGYDCDNYAGLKLAKFILPHVKGPVILAHSGGLKILEAMVLALDFKNVYLDISFSIPFWLGTSIEQDFVFAIRKLGTKRFLYGSDAPFIDLNFAKKSVEKFLIKHKFSVKDREDIFYNTANSLLRKKEQK